MLVIRCAPPFLKQSPKVFAADFNSGHSTTVTPYVHSEHPRSFHPQSDVWPVWWSFRTAGKTPARPRRENGGKLEVAQYIAGHANALTTKLYDRRKELLSKEEVEKIETQADCPSPSQTRVNSRWIASLPDDRQFLSLRDPFGSQPQEVNAAGQPESIQLPLVSAFSPSVHHGLHPPPEDVVEVDLDVLPLGHSIAERCPLLGWVRIVDAGSSRECD